MKSTLISTFALFVLVCTFKASKAYPTTHLTIGAVKNVKDNTDLLKDSGDTHGIRLRRAYEDEVIADGFNYDNDDTIAYDTEGDGASSSTYVPEDNTPIRREDTDGDGATDHDGDTNQESDTEDDTETKYTPLVRYQAVHTEVKKLFVPNLFG